MKKKTKAPAPQEKKSPAPQNAPEMPAVAPVVGRAGKERAWVAAYGLLLLLSMTVTTGRMAIILSALAVVSAACKWGRKAVIPCVPVMGFALYGIVYLAAGVWSPFEIPAVGEYVKFLAAFAMVVILLTRFGKADVPDLMWAFAGAGTFVSLICVDMDSARWVFDPFAAVTEALGCEYGHLVGTTTGTRLTGLYNNANVNACLAGLAALLALYLLTRSKTWKGRLVSSVMVGVNALTFMLFVSRGAIMCFGVACLVWLAATAKGKRVELFFHMVCCALPALALTYPAMNQVGVDSPLPTLLALACGVLIFALDSLLVRPLSAFLNAHIKLGVVLACAACAAVAAALVVAFSVTGPLTFGGTTLVSRVLSVTPGVHTLTLDADDGVQAKILIQNREEWQSGKGRTLWTGEGSVTNIQFTVPDEKDVTISLDLSGEAGQTVRSATVDGTAEVKMSYPLLPSSLSARMGEGLFTGNSFRNRMQFMADALKIWLTSPIWGRGLSSTEELYSAVQPFYYESKYVHNHVLQVMADMGLLGVLPFLAYAGGVLWLLLRRLKEERDELAAALLALWVLMIFHSMFELNFAIRAFQLFAYTLLMLPVLLYGKSLFGDGTHTQRANTRLASVVLAVSLLGTSLVFGTLFALHRWADEDLAKYETTSYNEFLDRLKLYYKVDVFCRESNMDDFLAVAMSNDTTGWYREDVLKYVDKLERMKTYSSLGIAASKYYLPLQDWDNAFRCSREGLQHEASTAEVWTMEMDYLEKSVLPFMGEEYVDVFAYGTLSLEAQLAEHNEKMLVPTKLDDQSAAFMEACHKVTETGMSKADAYAYLCEVAGVEE